MIALEAGKPITDALAEVERAVGTFQIAVEECFYAYEHLEAGGLIVNDVPSFRANNMPYGGVKDSGIDREGVRYVMEEIVSKLPLAPFFTDIKIPPLVPMEKALLGTKRIHSLMK